MEIIEVQEDTKEEIQEEIKKAAEEQEALENQALIVAASDTSRPIQVPEIVKRSTDTFHYVMSFADTKSLNRLAETCRYFSLASPDFNPKGLSVWKSKLIAAGCKETLLEEVRKKSGITDYKALYKNYFRMRKLKAGMTEAWELMCLSGDPKIIQKAWEIYPLTPETRGHECRSPIHYAAWAGSAEGIELLVKLGVNPQLTVYGKNLLCYALAGGSREAVKTVVALGIDPQERFDNGVNILLDAACGDNVFGIEMALELGIDLASTDDFGSNAMHFAIRSGSPQIIEALAKRFKERGLSLTSTNRYGAYPLHGVVYNSSIESIETTWRLLGSDASKLAQIRAHDRTNLLHFAAEYSTLPVFNKVVDLLGQTVATQMLSEKTAKNHYALHYAIRNKDGRVLGRILNLRKEGLAAQRVEGFPLNAQAPNLLLLVAKEGRLSTMQCLLDYLGDKALPLASATGAWGLNILHGAARSGSVELWQWLVTWIGTAKPKVLEALLNSVTDNHYCCPREDVLFFSVRSGNRALFKTVLDGVKDRGIGRLRRRNGQGANLLHIAAFRSPHMMAFVYELPDIKERLDLDAEAAAVDALGWNLLHYAASSPFPSSGIRQAMEILGDRAEACLGAVTRRGETPLHIAFLYGAPAVVEDLLKLGLSPNALTEGKNMLHCAVDSESQGDNLPPFFLWKMQVALKLGVDPIAVDEHGRNALHFAAKRGRISAIRYLREYLLARGLSINPSDRDNDGRDAYAYAIDNHGNRDLVRAVIEALKEHNTSVAVGCCCSIS